MSKETGIQWTDTTVNPTGGCDGCELWIPGKGGTCYAGHLHETRLAKNPVIGHLYDPVFTNVTLMPGRVAKAVRCVDLVGQPRPQRKGTAAKPWLDGLRRKIFIGDLSDIFSAAVTFPFLKQEVVDTALSPHGARHDLQVLTKRPQRAVEFARWLRDEHGLPWPSNVWVGTSVTSRASLGRLDHLVQMPTPVRFVSLEPQVEDVDLTPWLPEVQWVIVGGESDQSKVARPYNVAWARRTISDCRSAGVPVFVKQLGSNPFGMTEKLTDGHGGDWSQWPSDLRVREMPDPPGTPQGVEMSERKPLPEFMVRVKLPSAGAYSGGPSGDTEYDDAYRKAIAEALPAGFEVRWPRLGTKWPVDSEGFSFMPIACSDEETALATYVEEVRVLREQLDRIQTAVGVVVDRVSRGPTRTKP